MTIDYCLELNCKQIFQTQGWGWWQTLKNSEKLEKPTRNKRTLGKTKNTNQKNIDILFGDGPMEKAKKKTLQNKTNKSRSLEDPQEIRKKTLRRMFGFDSLEFGVSM